MYIMKRILSAQERNAILVARAQALARVHAPAPAPAPAHVPAHAPAPAPVQRKFVMK